AVVLHTSSYTEDADTQGYQVLIKDGRLCWEIVHHWPGSAIGLRTQVELPLQKWVRVAVTYDGSSRAAGMGIWLAGRRAATDVERDHLDGAATVRTQQLGGRDRDRGLSRGRIDTLKVWGHEIDAEAIWLDSGGGITIFDGSRWTTASVHRARASLHD